ncbi:heterodisulfide reductase subunit F [bacterium]|nr:MAG: heterodisulfide reductase subunit F [bacterium]
MENIYMPLPIRVKNVRVESDDKMLRTFDFEFVNEKDAFDYLPGQFCQLSIPGVGEAPFGIASSPTEEGFLRFTVNRVGVVTTALHHLQEGDIIGIRGPLGNYYPKEEFKGKNVVIVSGGFALTTLRSLTVYLRDPANRGDYGDITLIYGARRPGLMIYRDELEKWEKENDIEVHLTIDSEVEGWDKLVGFVPTVTKEISPSPKDAWVMLCGPPIMIKYTLPVLAEIGFPKERIYTSLERRMKCGIGKCGRCNIGSKYICLDGPVFSFAELEKIPEEI